MAHVHSFRRSSPAATVETCACGKWRHTENAGPAIAGIPAPRYGIATRRAARKLTLKTICELGTLAHNRAFSARDFREYTGQPTSMLGVLMRRGIVKRVGRGEYYPTPRGWKVIERACRRA